MIEGVQPKDAEVTSPSPDISKKPSTSRASPSPDISKKPSTSRASPSPETAKKQPPAVKEKPRKTADSAHTDGSDQAGASVPVAALANLFQKSSAKV